MTKLIKEYDSQFLQIYRVIKDRDKKKDKDKDKNKKKKEYKYYYKYLTNDLSKQEILTYISDTFPHNLLSISTGFMFISENAELPILPDYPVVDYKTNIKCLSNAFITYDKKDKVNVVISARPGNNCHPNCFNNVIVGYLIETDDDSSENSSGNKNDEIKNINTTFIRNKNDKDKENILKISKFDFNIPELVKKFKDAQLKLKDVKDFINFISKNCPVNIHYLKEITDSTFKKEITEKDIYYDYDIHSIYEIEIIKRIEEQFEDLNQIVKIYDNYNNIVDRIENKCKDMKIKYSSSEELKYKKLKKKGKEINKREFGIKWIELKYSDLLKLNLEYSLTDFIS